MTFDHTILYFQVFLIINKKLLLRNEGKAKAEVFQKLVRFLFTIYSLHNVR